ncbi:uncharacterized protein LOC108626288 [Ceratina calcarata]|uniref:Uncharacterized protein LOC108626288 n=1 Tax=Ceratina calcarata TaxID=156304 RepID=A0AAJ7S404_9HYME|nr:uncharacterized protein LOC108626288 [Ceratina calcarata]
MPPKKPRNKKGKEKNDKGKEQSDQYFDDIITVDETSTKDFEFLSNAPVSEDDHFVFKSEKNWNIDTSKFSEFFTLDLKTLSAAIESIPFNENVNIDKKYFTDDQLTSIYNTAEQGKEKYSKIVNNSEAVVTDKKNESEIQDSIDDIDFLLSLQKPVNESTVTLKSLPISYSPDSQIVSKPSTSTKPLDLEKWLDSVLDD